MSIPDMANFIQYGGFAPINLDQVISFYVDSQQCFSEGQTFYFIYFLSGVGGDSPIWAFSSEEECDSCWNKIASYLQERGEIVSI